MGFDLYPPMPMTSMISWPQLLPWSWALRHPWFHNLYDLHTHDLHNLYDLILLHDLHCFNAQKFHDLHNLYDPDNLHAHDLFNPRDF